MYGFSPEIRSAAGRVRLSSMVTDSAALAVVPRLRPVVEGAVLGAVAGEGRRARRVFVAAEAHGPSAPRELPQRRQHQVAAQLERDECDTRRRRDCGGRRGASDFGSEWKTNR